MKKQLITSLLIFFLLLLLTSLFVLYGKGYRIGQLEGGKPTISKTGLLATTSKPTGAQVFIDGNLTTATDDPIDLLPGEYTVKIEKEGYLPWEKRVKIQKGVVTKADALLFPTAPRLESITSIGVENPVLDPSSRKLAFRVSSQSAKRNGLYILEMSTTPILTLQNSAKQITDDVTALFSASDYVWSPTGEEITASISGELGIPYYFLLNTAGFNDSPRNITATLPSIEEQWQALRDEKTAARMNGLPGSVKKLIQDNFSIHAWSMDDDKILYTASRSAELPIIIKPRHIGIDSLREVRTIRENDVYVYDIKDDVNTKVMSFEETGCKDAEGPCVPPIKWFPDSRHLIVVKDSKINVMETDGTNSTTVYAGPFIDNFVFPWPNGSKIVILTNFNNSGVPANLYTISLQ